MKLGLESTHGKDTRSVELIGEHRDIGNELLELIETDVSILHGQARLRGTRVSVSVVLDYLAAGMTEEGTREQHPSLPEGAVRAAIAYGAYRSGCLAVATGALAGGLPEPGASR